VSGQKSESMADCTHLYIRKGLHNSSATLVCWKNRASNPVELEPGDCNHCPQTIRALLLDLDHLDIADHPLAFHHRPDPPRKPITPAEMAARYR